MKKVAFILALLFVGLCGCTEEDKELKDLTRQFIRYMNEGDNYRAGQLGTESTKRFLAYRTANMIELGQAATTNMSVEKINCTTEAERAACRFCCDPNGDEFAVPYVRKGDTWLVNIDIDDLIKQSKK